METANLLFADDDPETRTLVSHILKKEGINFILAENGSDLLEKWRNNQVDVIVVDIMMPVLDGLEACRRIRRVSDVPIVFLTAKVQEQDIIEGFESGADDYIVKPFRPAEFILRVRAVLKRSNRQRIRKGRRLSFEKIMLDLDSRRVVSRGKNIQVTPLEFQLLRYLMEHAGVVLRKEDLLHDVWGYVKPAGDMNLIEAAVRRLRRKLELDPSRPEYIQTVWGLGYRFGD